MDSFNTQFDFAVIPWGVEGWKSHRLFSPRSVWASSPRTQGRSPKNKQSRALDPCKSLQGQQAAGGGPGHAWAEAPTWLPPGAGWEVKSNLRGLGHLRRREPAWKLRATKRTCWSSRASPGRKRKKPAGTREEARLRACRRRRETRRRVPPLPVGAFSGLSSRRGPA